jgi:hypothetical protein
VIKFQAVRYRFTEALEHEAVGGEDLAAGAAADDQHAVALIVDRAAPWPALIRATCRHIAG